MTAHPVESMSLFDALLKSNAFNLALVVALLAFVFKKFQLANAVTRQRDAIAADLASARAKRNEAEALLQEAEKRLSSLNDEITLLMANAQASAEALQTKILANAEQEASRLLEAARQRALLEEKAAVAQVKADFIRQAVADVRVQLTDETGASNAHRVAINSLMSDLHHLPLRMGTR
ncbi:MAG: ATP synthase F0 subunit B [Vampirovibrionales bacterium]|nr:ATP synthase F0 subunit B [Vampirovibrionales bacterium]